MPTPHLTRRDVDGHPNGLILMLHGGKAESLVHVGDRSASWWRSNLMLRDISGRANLAGISVWLLRYERRGWNEHVASPPSPVPDARGALDEVRRQHGDVAVVLLGHSMGARTAVAVADDASVAGVVALAPWLPAGEPVGSLSGTHLAVAHGRRDKITSAAQAEDFVRRARSVAASTEFKDIGPVGHYMLRRMSAWNDFAIAKSLAFVQHYVDGQ